MAGWRHRACIGGAALVLGAGAVFAVVADAAQRRSAAVVEEMNDVRGRVARGRDVGAGLHRMLAAGVSKQCLMTALQYSSSLTQHLYVLRPDLT